MSQVDVDAVKAAAPISGYLRSRGFEPRRVGNSWRCACPFCGGSEKATKFAMRPDDDFAKCFDCDWSGDIIDLVQNLQQATFPQAVDLLVGGDLTLTKVAHTRILGLPVKGNIGSQDARTEAKNQDYWQALAHRDGRAEAFLTRRGLESIRHPNTVRFDGRGGICVPIRSTTDGRVINVATRALHNNGPKVYVRKGHAKGCFGDVRHLDECHGPLVLVEGLTDYLAALALFNSNLPLGANGASRFGGILEELADRLGERGVWIAADNDEAGDRAVAACLAVATRCGLPLGSLERISLKSDLNEALVEASDA